MERVDIQLWYIIKVFVRTGASSFGGWSTTALLLEKELVNKRKLLTQKQLKGSITYAQILPGATQVSIVANVGFRLRGFTGALIATISYLLPAISLITIFAAIYFHFTSDSAKLTDHLHGLIAALSGVILANAYRLGSKHTTKTWLWLFAIIAFTAKLWFGVNALLIIVVFGVGGLVISWARTHKTTS